VPAGKGAEQVRRSGVVGGSHQACPNRPRGRHSRTAMVSA
jgi:hypothetical protein